MLKENEILGLKDLHSKCINEGLPFVSFSLPNIEKVKTYVQFSSEPTVLTGFDNLDKCNGFLISPFTEDKHAIYLIKPDVIYDSNTEKEVFPDLSGKTTVKKWTNTDPVEFSSTLKHDFVTQTGFVKQQIEKGVVDKVVLSRVYVEQLNEDFNITALFGNLCKAYPHAFKYVFNIPELGCWMGASPEPLVLMGENIVETVSLAGTRKLNGIPFESVRWSDKELDEQGIVTDYIEAKLKSFGITDFNKSGPVNYKAANVIHLKSTFEFDKNLLNNRLGGFINALHPSPSVCGFPKDRALAIINNTELHDRAYYSGVIGTVGMDGETNLYVNLRCMRIDNKKALLYAGAGITSGSDPDAEWDETEQKLQTLLSVMHTIAVTL